MSETSGIKGHLLRQAVHRNIDVLEGRFRYRQASPSHQLQKAGRAFFFFAVPLALFGSSYLLSAAAEGWVGSRESGERARIEELEAATTRMETEVRAAKRWRQAEAARSVSSEELLAGTLTTLPAPIDPAVFSLGVGRVIIDPGHGGDNSGTKSPQGLVEKTMALDISKRLEELLVEASYEVEMTRREDQFVSLEERAALANERRGDIFVSVHLNWIEEREIRGVETYYLGPTDDPYLTKLAAKENLGSGYSLADFRKMLDRVYVDIRQGESERLAMAVQNELFGHLRKVNPQLQDRGIKKAPFIVLTGTEMPAILAEVSCLSNEKEARLLMSPGYRQYIAEALFSGIEFYARNLNGMDPRGS